MKIILSFILLLSATQALALRNGTYFKAEQFPEVIGSYQTPRESCTSTKIAPKTYLTAAHCIKVLDLSDKVQRRIYFRKSIQAVSATIEKIYFHPTVDLSSFSNAEHPNLRIGVVIGHIFGNKVMDIAIFQIKEELPEIKAMPLYFGVLHKNQLISLAGYGDTGNGYPLYPRWGLQKIRSISDTFIKIKHSKEYPAEIMSGDSGSPLIVTENEQHFLAGVAVWKKPGFFGGAAYFVNPENFVDWATDVIQGKVEANLSY